MEICPLEDCPSNVNSVNKHSQPGTPAGAAGLVALGKLVLVGLVLGAGLTAQPRHVAAQDICGEVVSLTTRDAQTIAYSFAEPTAPEQSAQPSKPQVALVLLPGGSGLLDLDADGCPRKFRGNSLVRSLALFQGNGFFTALVDAPSDYRTKDGLGDFRTSPKHAEDLGAVIADVRSRTNLPVFLVGTSRGTISAANAASRLSGPGAPDGVVLTSPLTLGRAGTSKTWVGQTVFDLRLSEIRMPILVIAHAADTCGCTPPRLAGKIIERTKSAREQLAMVTGGPGVSKKLSRIKACQGRTPHGYIGQESEVAEGIARFVRGGGY